jgi:hypothetical protein
MAADCCSGSAPDIEWPVMSAAEQEAVERSEEEARIGELVAEWEALREEWSEVLRRPMPGTPEDPHDEYVLGDPRPWAVHPELETELFVLHRLLDGRLAGDAALSIEMSRTKSEAFYYPNDLPLLAVGYETTSGRSRHIPLCPVAALELAVSCGKDVREAFRSFEPESVPDTPADYSWLEPAARNAAAIERLIDERIPELDGRRVGLEYLKACVTVVHGVSSGSLRVRQRPGL